MIRSGESGSPFAQPQGWISVTACCANATSAAALSSPRNGAFSPECNECSLISVATEDATGEVIVGLSGDHVFDVFDILFADNLFVKAVDELFFVEYFLCAAVTRHKSLFYSAGIVEPFGLEVTPFDINNG